MTTKVLLVKYGEIALRKGNRTYFEHRLLDAMRHNLATEIAAGSLKVLREQGRFLVESPYGDVCIDSVLPKIKHIFGLTAFCPAVKAMDMDINKLKEVAVNFVANNTNGAKTFKVETKRSDKRYPLQSGQISAEVGGAIFTANLGLAVDLHNPDMTVRIELRNHAYIYANSIPGEGGLPYGGSGKGVLLLSGGLDSPVAGYLTAKRGVEIAGIYFHSPPFVSDRALDKVKDLSRELTKFTGAFKLCVIPFTEVQLFLKDAIHPEKLTILLKRAMFHIANKFAQQQAAQCLITGDSVGQVASQTMHSIAAVNSAAELAVLRPLSILDKQAIIDIAKDIGTYPISIRPYDDCCTLFVAKHPESKPNTKIIEKIEAQMFDQLLPLVEAAFQNAEYFEL